MKKLLLFLAIGLGFTTASFCMKDESQAASVPQSAAEKRLQQILAEMSDEVARGSVKGDIRKPAEALCQLLLQEDSNLEGFVKCIISNIKDRSFYYAGFVFNGEDGLNLYIQKFITDETLRENLSEADLLKIMNTLIELYAEKNLLNPRSYDNPLKYRLKPLMHTIQKFDAIKDPAREDEMMGRLAKVIELLVQHGADTRYALPLATNKKFPEAVIAAFSPKKEIGKPEEAGPAAAAEAPGRSKRKLADEQNSDTDDTPSAAAHNSAPKRAKESNESVE